MRNRFDKLLFTQASRKLQPYMALRDEIRPQTGWVATVRKALGITMQQLGKRMGKSAQAIREIQKREEEGSISLNSLKETANAMGMQVVYAIIPKTSASLEEYVQKLAEEKATEIVSRTHHTMLLEDQQTNEQRIRKSISEIAEEYMNEPKRLPSVKISTM